MSFFKRLKKAVTPPKRLRKMKPVDFFFGQGSIIDSVGDFLIHGCAGEYKDGKCVMTKDQYKLSQQLKEGQDATNQALNILATTQAPGSLPPMTTGTNVTTGFTPNISFGNISEQDLNNLMLAYGDNTAFTPDELGEMQTDMATTPEPEETTKPKFRKMSPYFYTKGEDEASNLTGLINQLLAPQMQQGGPISMASMPKARRMYSKPKKKKTVMQTSTKGMPMRGMQSGVPMMKQGGTTKKKYHT